MKSQNQLIFWEDEQPSLVQRRWWVNPENEECPFHGFVGNEAAIRRLGRSAFIALGRNNHCSNDSFAFCGPPSTGKTTLVRTYADLLGLPFVEVEPQSIRKVHDLFLLIKKVCSEFDDADDLSLVEVQKNKYILPPIVVFIDEVHNLKQNVVQGLLKATEPNDRQMVTEEGVSVDTSLVCWCIATTDRGDLFDAFDTRFQKINLNLYTKKEMAQIIRIKNSDWPIEICELVAHYNPFVPREALTFANDMRAEHEMNPDDSWDVIARRIAEDHGIDEYGMTLQRLKVLEVLGQGPISASQLPHLIFVKEDELRKFVLPPLQAITTEQPVPLITVSSRGFTITQAGLKELDRRGISNRGIEAIPEQSRDAFSTGN